ncbi:hypothetical protein D3C73_1134170 [compost metagenome]
MERRRRGIRLARGWRQRHLDRRQHQLEQPQQCHRRPARRRLRHLHGRGRHGNRGWQRGPRARVGPSIRHRPLSPARRTHHPGRQRRQPACHRRWRRYLCVGPVRRHHRQPAARHAGLRQDRPGVGDPDRRQQRLDRPHPDRRRRPGNRRQVERPDGYRPRSRTGGHRPSGHHHPLPDRSHLAGQ